ncbi:hypothetical protein GCM10022227_16490 [Streptomyces sedi]
MTERAPGNGTRSASGGPGPGRLPGSLVSRGLAPGGERGAARRLRRLGAVSDEQSSECAARQKALTLAEGAEGHRREQQFATESHVGDRTGHY